MKGGAVQAELVPLLEDPFALVSRRVGPVRQQTLKTSIEWSHDLPDPDERLVFARLAVFPGPFGRHAAGQVAAARRAVLGGLAAKSVIYVVPEPSRTRYRMLDMLRAFGLDRLGDAGEETATRERHLEWWAKRAEAAWGHGTVPASTAAFEQVSEDIDDLRGALRFAAERSPALGLQLIGDTGSCGTDTCSRRGWSGRFDSSAFPRSLASSVRMR
jgi:predicted ATPase